MILIVILFLFSKVKDSKIQVTEFYLRLVILINIF